MALLYIIWWTSSSSRAKYGIEEMCRDQWNWASKNPYGYGSPDSIKQNGHQTNGSADSSKQNGHRTNGSTDSPKRNGHHAYGSADSPKRNGHCVFGSSDLKPNGNGHLRWAELFGLWAPCTFGCDVSSLHVRSRSIVNPLSEIDVDHWVDRSYSIEPVAEEFLFAVGKAYLLLSCFFLLLSIMV